MTFTSLDFRSSHFPSVNPAVLIADEETISSLTVHLWGILPHRDGLEMELFLTNSRTAGPLQSVTTSNAGHYVCEFWTIWEELLEALSMLHVNCK